MKIWSYTVTNKSIEDAVQSSLHKAKAAVEDLVSLLYQKKWLKQLICTWEKE